MVEKISRRKVFYLSGFDPRGVRHYHKFYKEEIFKQYLDDDKNIEISDRAKISSLESEWCIKNDSTSTDCSVLKWDDIIRSNWEKSNSSLLLKSFKTYYHYLKNLNLVRCYNLGPNTVFTLFLPLIYVILVALSFAAIIFLSTESLGFFGFLLGAIAIYILFFKSLEVAEKYKILWLFRIYVFCAKPNLFNRSELTKRTEEFAKIISGEVEKDEYDEYLIIGHSVGAMLCMSTMAKLIENNPKLNLDKVKIILIAQTIPIISYLYNAQKINDEIKIIANTNIRVLDIGAKVDGACYALKGPFINICEVKKAKLKLISPRYHKMFSDSKYRALKYDRYRMHFQYMMASDVKSYYDYFDITSGPVPLEARYEFE